MAAVALDQAQVHSNIWVRDGLKPVPVSEANDLNRLLDDTIALDMLIKLINKSVDIPYCGKRF